MKLQKRREKWFHFGIKSAWTVKIAKKTENGEKNGFIFNVWNKLSQDSGLDLKRKYGKNHLKR